MFRKSISSVLITAVALAVILTVTAIVTYVSRSTYHLALEQQKQAMQQMTRVVNTALDSYLGNTKTLVETLAVQQAIIEAFGGDPSRAKERLKEYIKAHKDYWAILLFDAKGAIVAGYNAKGEDMAGENRAERAYVKAVLGGADLFVDKELLNAKSGGGEDNYVFALAKAVKSADGKLLGGVGAFPKWEAFTKAFIDPPRFGERGYGFMFDAKGRFIAHAVDKSLMLKDFTDQEFVRKALEIKNGDLFYDWKGEQKYMVVATNPDTGWLVCMSAYVSELTETATNQRNVLTGVGLAAVIILVVAIMFFINRLVVRPLHEIEGFTAEIAKGNFQAQLGTHFKFEMKSLSANIRAMVVEIKNKLGFAQGVLDGFVLPCSVFGTDNTATFINSHMMTALDKDSDPKAHYGETSGQFFYGERDRQTLTLQVLNEKKRLDTEVERPSPQGNRVFDVTATPISDLDGNLLGVLTVWFELTEIRAQQKKIEAQNQKIAQAASAANTVSDQVASASEELSAQIEESSRGSEEQRNRTGEAATAMEEMNATVMEVAKSASTAAELADKAKAKAQEGEKLVDDVVATINQVNTKAEELKGDMTELGKQAEGIGQIMTVIADIADQTNLLALNAAIEAARAGDAGRGFAVVADEVRKLAEKTMSATNEVENYIKAVQTSARKNIQGTEATTKAILASTETAGKSGAALREIVDMVERTADQVRGIATASEEQSAASEEISRTTEDINRIAGETAEAMTQSAQAVSDLARLAQELKTIINNMQD